MAQAIKTFFDLGDAKRIADPRVAEQQRQQQLAIEEARRQDALRAALAGENLQRQQLAASQQNAMARLGLDQGRLGLDREKFAFGKEEAGKSREHDMLLERLRQGGMDSRQQAGFDHASSMAADRREFDALQSALGRDFQAGQKGLDRDHSKSLADAQIEAAMDRLLRTEKGAGDRQAAGFDHASSMADKQIAASAAEADKGRQMSLHGIMEANRRSDRAYALDERRLSAQERRFAEQRSAEERAVVTSGLAKIAEATRGRSLGDASTIEDLRRLARYDPSVAAALPVIAPHLRFDLAKEHGDQIGGAGDMLGKFFSWGSRDPGAENRMSGYEMFTGYKDPLDRRMKEQDRLRGFLEGGLR